MLRRLAAFEDWGRSRKATMSSATICSSLLRLLEGQRGGRGWGKVRDRKRESLFYPSLTEGSEGKTLEGREERVGTRVQR